MPPGRARLQADDVGLLELQFGRVLAGDDALVIIDELRETVEQRGLARTRAAGNQAVDAASADVLALTALVPWALTTIYDVDGVGGAKGFATLVSSTVDPTRTLSTIEAMGEGAVNYRDGRRHIVRFLGCALGCGARRSARSRQAAA